MFKAMIYNNTSKDISWSYFIFNCTDGAAALPGHKKGFQAEVASHINFIHYINHRQVLASCDLQPQLHTALQEAVKAMTLAKTCPL
jgi:hypothetical protein